MTRSPGTWQSTVALLLAAASGFAGLAYQVIWTQQGSLWLGHESAAVLAVVAAFFGGMAVGALGWGSRIQASAKPLRWYVVCELLIGIWALVLAFAFAPASRMLLQLIGPEPAALRHWLVAFAGTFALLLPATSAMGLTLPALARVVPATGRAISSFGALYAANTLGAVTGVIATAFWLVPGHGLMRTAACCALVNFLCALFAAVALRAGSSGQEAMTTEGKGVQPEGAARKKYSVLVHLAATGLLGIGYEVVAVRVLSQVTEQTVYSFAAALAVYLTGTSVGAAAYQRWLSRRDAERTDAALVMSLSVATLIGAMTIWGAEALRDAIVAATGATLAGAALIEAALSLAAFALPTLVMGALFCHLCNRARSAGAGFGVAAGWNGVGAAVAPLVFGVVLVPLVGPKHSLLLVSAGYLLLLPRRAFATPVVLLPAGAIVLAAAFAPRLAFIDVPPGGQVLSYLEGATAAVSVVEDAEGVRRLRIDNRQQEGSNNSYAFDARQAWLPLLLHPEPGRALFLGMGTGVTASAAADAPGLQTDVVELLPEVIASSGFFTDVFTSPAGGARMRVVAADARRFVRASPQRYDAIISDNFHPARSGAGSLYTVEHFQAVRRRLTEGGVFCQWLPLHQLDLATLRSIVGAFLQVFPAGAALLANNSLETPVIGLVGRESGAGFDVAELSARRARISGAVDLAGLALDDEFAVLGSFIAGPRSLARFASSARVNTDDLPVVSYRAPRLTYAPDSTPRDRLLELVDAWQVAPGDVLADAQGEFAARLAAYWHARGLYLKAGRGVRSTGDVVGMLAQVRAPLLEVLRASPDFRPARQPLLGMARALAKTDPQAARGLLEDMLQIAPGDPQLRAMHDRIPR